LQRDFEIGKTGHTKGRSLVLCVGREIDDCSEFCLWFFKDTPDVSLSDHAGTGNGDAHWGVHGVVSSLAVTPSPVEFRFTPSAAWRAAM
jgi:hypothetical protein